MRLRPRTSRRRYALVSIVAAAALAAAGCGPGGGEAPSSGSPNQAREMPGGGGEATPATPRGDYGY